MATSANSEQLKAIEHSGGVLLKAGAGSGKTFVLKEHMIYRTSQWHKDFESNTNEMSNFSDYLASKYSKTVLMTFTKKAAGELQIRLRNEFVAKSVEEGGYWLDAVEVLDKLTVTTIHGFCFKLIKEGHFVNINSNTTIIDSEEFSKKVKFLFQSWIESQKVINPFLIKDSDKVAESLIKVFADPVLRRSWRDVDPNNYKESSEIIKDLIEIKGISEVFTSKVDLNPENKGKKWYDFLILFLEQRFDLEEDNSFIRINTFFKNLNYRIPVSPRGKTVTEEEKCFYVLVKDLNQFLKSDGEDIEQYLLQFKDSVLPWFESIKSAFDYVEKNYFSVQGVTFSDLEYIVYSELQSDEAQRSVSERYNYLIVDEFQDTSFIQYEIIKKVLNNDLKKLFCVGDIKQAIYGFRGGELGVFLNCAKEIPTVLSLKNNYRSDQNIIHFNNKFFSNIFKKNVKFEGVEKNAVEVEFQEVPIASRALGRVENIDIDLKGVKSLANSELELVEAYAILNKIKENAPVKDVVLYKKLKPSILLMGLLIKEDISFTAQVKVPYLEDPILAIFLSLIENKFNQNEQRDESLVLTLTSYLAIIGVSFKDDYLKYEIEKFNESIMFFGLYQSYFTFLNSMKIFNSNYKNNLKYIENVTRLYKDDLESLVSVISKKGTESYSLDFNFGDKPEQLNIMSAHASKGLEFNRVYLGGVYTNDKAFPDQSIFGKIPFSFVWRDNLNSKKRYKTPQLLLEREISKKKDFSESKRLFYVASTRAENELRWVNINLEDVKFRKQSNSWIQGINSWIEDAEDLDIINNLKSSNHLTINSEQLSDSVKKRPLFQIDEVGITLSDKSMSSFVMPELSVTRLATIHTCPRKFYLKNILKIEIDKPSNNQFFETGPIEVKSSSSRGTDIHEEISQIILNEFDQTSLDLKFVNEVKWTIDTLKEKLPSHKFISEKPIKFEFFGHMISGIPDLIISPLNNNNNNEILEIWDFKTGQSKSDDDSIYHFQLLCYAYSQYILNEYSRENQIKIVLCYVDETKVVEQTHSFTEIEDYLRSYWNKTNMPWIRNESACDECEFNEICK